MWLVPRSGHVYDAKQSTKRVIVQAVGNQEILVLIIAGGGPEEGDFLRLDIALRVWGTW